MDNLRKRKAKGDNPERKSRQMKLVSRVNAIIYGKDNPERIPDLTACRFGVGLTTPPCKQIKLLKHQTIENSIKMLKHCWRDKAKTNEMAWTCDENGIQ